MSSDELHTPIDCLAKRFLCSYPMQSFVWNERLSEWDAQQALIDSTIYHGRNVAYPVRVSYQKAFLKWIIHNVEHAGKEVNDNVYTALGDVVIQPDTNAKCYKHYQTEYSVVSLYENVKFISEGTTGLITWESALALSEWCIANQHRLEGKTILELGSGLGLVGLTIALHCRPRHVVLTDCHDAVLEQLAHNVALNLSLAGGECSDGAGVATPFSDAECVTYGHFQQADGKPASSISVVRHAWGVDDEELAHRVDAELILAADIVYDFALFPALAECVNACLRRRVRSRADDSTEIKPELILVCTERFSLTLDKFINILKETCEVVEGVAPKQKCFVWSTDRPIRFFAVKAK